MLLRIVFIVSILALAKVGGLALFLQNSAPKKAGAQIGLLRGLTDQYSMQRLHTSLRNSNSEEFHARRKQMCILGEKIQFGLASESEIHQYYEMIVNHTILGRESWRSPRKQATHQRRMQAMNLERDAALQNARDRARK